MKIHWSINLRGAYVADQIVGKAAVMFYIVMGIKGAYAPFMSEVAVRMMVPHNIIFEYDESYRTLSTGREPVFARWKRQ